MSSQSAVRPLHRPASLEQTTHIRGLGRRLFGSEIAFNDSAIEPMEEIHMTVKKFADLTSLNPNQTAEDSIFSSSEKRALDRRSFLKNGVMAGAVVATGAAIFDSVPSFAKASYRDTPAGKDSFESSVVNVPGNTIFVRRVGKWR